LFQSFSVVISRICAIQWRLKLYQFTIVHKDSLTFRVYIDIRAPQDGTSRDGYLIDIKLDKLSLKPYKLVVIGHFEKLLAVNVMQDEMKTVLHKILIDKLLLNFLCWYFHIIWMLANLIRQFSCVKSNIFKQRVSRNQRQFKKFKANNCIYICSCFYRKILRAANSRP